MIRLQLLAVLFGLAGAALAQTPATPLLNPCTGLPATAPYYEDINLDKPWPVCASPTLPRVDANAFGLIGWRWCKVPAGGYWQGYAPQWGVIPWSDFTAQPGLALRLMSAGLAMNEAALNTIALEYKALIKPLAHPDNTAIWCPLWPTVYATKPSPPATTPSPWMVAANGANTSRPTYPVAAGIRQRTPNGVALVRSDCDITAAIIEPAYPGASVKFTFGVASGTPANSVTLCVRRP